MSSPDSHPRQLSRRRALAGAAWSAPVIVVASAVPAFAVSPGADLDLQRGSSATLLTTDGDDFYFDLQFTGLSVVVPGAGLTPGQLTLTVTYTPTSPGGPAGLFVLGAPAGWTVSPDPGSTGAAVLFTYGAAVPGGTEVQVESGIFVGSDEPTSSQTGTYVVTASAPGLTSDAEAFPTGPARSGGQAARAIQRPAVS